MTTNIGIKLGGTLKGIRLQKGKTRQEIADLLGITRQQIFNYERGHTRIPADRLYELAAALQVNIGEFWE